MSHYLKHDAQLNCQLDELNKKLTKVNIAVEKASVDKDYFIKYLLSSVVVHDF